MKIHKLLLVIFSLGLLLPACNSKKEKSNKLKQVSVPIAGNAYLTKGSRDEGITGKGISKWESPSNVYSIFVGSKNPAKAKLAIRARVKSGKSKIQVKTGNFSQKITLDNTSFKQILLGKVQLKKGYNRIDISGLSKSGPAVARISDLILKIPKNDSLTFIRNNKNNHFYWGRRGPSVHLDYKLPAHKKLSGFTVK